MRAHSTTLTILACSALAACGGDRAVAERERPKDFRTAADEICREHDERVSEARDERGRQVSVDEFVGASSSSFYSMLANSDIQARNLAERLGLRDCSPPTTHL